jgi:hypothetical protein
MSDGPVIRGIFTKTNLRQLEREPPEIYRRAMELAPVGLFDTVRAASSFEWVTLRIHMPLIEAIHQALRIPSARRAFWKAPIQYYNGLPLLKNINEGFVRLFGRDPGQHLKGVDKLWGLVVRDCGTVTTEFVPGSRQAVMSLAGFPPEYFRSGVFAETMEYTFEGVVEALGLTGQVETANLDLERGSVRYVVTWA